MPHIQASQAGPPQPFQMGLQRLGDQHLFQGFAFLGDFQVGIAVFTLEAIMERWSMSSKTPATWSSNSKGGTGDLG
jgi:hypothetical protein